MIFTQFFTTMPLASFYSHVSGTNDEVTALLGGVKLEMVCGDITKAGTDVIVNTTGFLNQHSGMIWMILFWMFLVLNKGVTVIIAVINSTGVSKAILTAAGLSVQGELAKGKYSAQKHQVKIF